MAVAIFGGGCFWGIEDAFRKVPGVTEVVSGYAGGQVENPSYEDVCSGRTGHAEVVRVEFDPQIISYQELLEVFWSVHDPSTRNRQGPDIGTQYRSIIIAMDQEQHAAATDSIEELEKRGVFDAPVTTEVLLKCNFFKAEEYHQRYYEKNGSRSCGF